MSWRNILKTIRVIGKVYTVDGKQYHFSPEHIEEYNKEFNNPYLQGKNVEMKKRIALRNVVRKFGLQPK